MRRDLPGRDETRRGDWVRGVSAGGGVELLHAWFGGRAYARHRHDTYAICLTLGGVQQFDYRGTTETSLAGDVVVLHPDEPHDGRAGAEGGFGYKSVYVAPERVAEAARALCGSAAPLPFARAAVAPHPTLARALADAFAGFPGPFEPLAVDALVEALARGLVEADPSLRHRRRAAGDIGAAERARAFLAAERRRVVTAAELERVAGADRFSLARSFRKLYGTSPYRYLLMRRLDDVRAGIRAGMPLAGLAADAGFADQAHMTRLFRAAYGLSPGRYRSLAA